MDLHQTSGIEAGAPEATPLSEWEVLHTSDLEQAYSKISKEFKSHTFDVQPNSNCQDTLLHKLDLGKSSINYIQYGCDITVDPGSLDDFYLVHMPVRGGCRVEYNGEAINLAPYSAAVCSPFDPSKFQWSSDCGVMAIKIQLSAVQAYLERKAGGSFSEPARFDARMDSQSTAGKSFKNLVDFILVEAQTGSQMLSLPAYREQMTDLVISTLLNLQPSNVQTAFSSTVSSAAPRHVRWAEEYIHENLTSHISIADLERLTGVTGRTLLNGFREFRGTTPMKYLETLRLDRARSELQAASPGMTVGDIATRWGFNHQSRFAQRYKLKFGETPSQTLRN